MDWICFIKALLLASVLASGLTLSNYRPIPNCVVVSFRGAACGEHRPSVPPKVGGMSFPSSPRHHHHFSPTSFCIHTHEGRTNIDQMVVAIYGVNNICSLSCPLATFSGTIESEVFWFHWSGKLRNLHLGVWSWSMGVERVIMIFCLLLNWDREALNTAILS